MKILNYFFIIAMSFLVIGCDKDDDETSSETSLKGMWQGSFQNLKASEGGTYPVQILFKDDGRFEITNLESDDKLNGHYESYLTLQAITLKVFGDKENELSLSGVRDYSFKLVENELELKSPFSLFRLKRTLSNKRDSILGVWSCSDQENGNWVLNLNDKDKFEIFYLVNGRNRLSMRGFAEWNNQRSQAELVVEVSVPYQSVESWEMLLDEETNTISMVSDSSDFKLECTR